jgi:superfamily I DNA/RNA helicase
MTLRTESKLVPMWKRCERAFSDWLAAQGYMVVNLANAEGNTIGTNAPMVTVGSRSLRAPDIHTKKGAIGEYWEVKYRSRPFMDVSIGRLEHRVDVEAFRDYHELCSLAKDRVWLVVYEAPTSMRPARWLRIDVEQAYQCGRRSMCPGIDDVPVDSWLWPVEAMSEIEAPLVEAHGTVSPVVSDDGTKLDPVAPQIADPEGWYKDPERRLRHRDAPFTEPLEAKHQTLRMDPVAGLDVLRRSLGVPALPCYSVMLVGGKGVSIDDALGMLDYGIRVFLVLGEPLTAQQSARVEAFADARLIEVQHVSDIQGHCEWIVDGNWPEVVPSWLDDALRRADTAGGINLKQYQIVHASVGANVLVTAGAGTGKTETMAERMMYLLATTGESASADHADDGRLLSERVSLDHFALVTFTREAASEMRRRLARTFTLRQRMCRRCVHPTSAWLMQLGRARISTIHLFARDLIREFGTSVGLGPGFKVTARTLPLRDHITDALSQRLPAVFQAPSNDVPAVHEWRSHIEAVWEAMENNGVPITQLDPGKDLEVNWGTPDPVHDLVREVILEVAARMARDCLETQSLRAAQLVPVALQAVQNSARSIASEHSRRLRYLFVDEFQDTDSTQIDLVLAVQQILGARLFVVGDVKQGIYRFRGAAGDAFDALRARCGAVSMTEFDLTRNFRSDGNLLDSLHTYFAAWGRAGLLPYSNKDRLIARTEAVSKGHAINMVAGGQVEKVVSMAAKQALEWQSHEPDARIAVLCRRNSQAMRVQQRIRDYGGQCELAVGGQFFLTEPVRELRAFLDAVLNPGSNAKLLELCETRWAPAILRGGLGVDFSDDRDAWSCEASVPMCWSGRAVSIGHDGRFDCSDLVMLRRRVASIGGMLRRLSAIGFVVECNRLLHPGQCERSSDEKRTRAVYGRNLDHLITLLDAQFAESSATADAVLEWLKLQIATNRQEDEPLDPELPAGTLIAMTVHKAKGLEFDHVIIPFTHTPFEPPDAVATQVCVVESQGQRCVRVRWHRYPSLGDGPEWDINDQEVEREEARLLYVAATRARRNLVILRSPWAAQDKCWQRLLNLGEHP